MDHLMRRAEDYSAEQPLLSGPSSINVLEDPLDSQSKVRFTGPSLWSFGTVGIPNALLSVTPLSPECRIQKATGESYVSGFDAWNNDLVPSPSKPRG